MEALPADTYDKNLPGFTAHRCYNPQANGAPRGEVYDTTTNSYISDGGSDNNNTAVAGTGVDPVENPQLGIVFCDSSPPHTYGLYWHDMGGFGVDLLGYYNLVVPFTCSTPPTSNSGGGASLLSG